MSSLAVALVVLIAALFAAGQMGIGPLAPNTQIGGSGGPLSGDLVTQAFESVGQATETLLEAVRQLSTTVTELFNTR